MQFTALVSAWYPPPQTTSPVSAVSEAAILAPIVPEVPTGQMNDPAPELLPPVQATKARVPEIAESPVAHVFPAVHCVTAKVPEMTLVDTVKAVVIRYPLLTRHALSELPAVAAAVVGGQGTEMSESSDAGVAASVAPVIQAAVLAQAVALGVTGLNAPVV